MGSLHAVVPPEVTAQMAADMLVEATVRPAIHQLERTAARADEDGDRLLTQALLARVRALEGVVEIVPESCSTHDVARAFGRRALEPFETASSPAARHGD